MTTTELTKNLAGLFNGDSPDRYFSFLELYKQHGQILITWRERFKDHLAKRFEHEIDDVKWGLRHWPGYELAWTFYIAEEGLGQDSVSIYLENTNLKFWGGGNFNNANQLNSLMRSEHFRQLFELGLEIDFNPAWNMYTKAEEGRWQFGCHLDNHFKDHIYELLWYAGNKTEEFTTQVLQKLDRIRRNPELVALLKQLNQEAISTIL